MTTELIKYFHSNITTLLGIEHLPDAEKASILERLSNVLEQRIFLRIADKLGATDRGNFITLLVDEKVSDEQKFAFIHNHIPNMPEFIEQEIALFKKELKQSVDEEVANDLLIEEA